MKVLNPLDPWTCGQIPGQLATMYILYGGSLSQKMRYLVIFFWYHYFLLDNQVKRWIVSRYTAGVSSIFSKIIYIIYDVFHKK